MPLRYAGAFLSALVWSGAAEADVTARYAVRADGPPVIVVQVSDSGDSYVGDGSGEGAVTTGGVTYIVGRDPGGLFAVRRDDMHAVVIEMVRSMVPGGSEDLPTLEQPPGYGPVSDGAESVGDRRGTRWGMGFDGAVDLEAVFVVSEDADLAPVGAAMARSFDEIPSGYGISVGPNVSLSATAPMLGIIRRGTLIRMGEMLYFRSLETGPVPASAFALPSTILSRDRFRERMMRELLGQR